MDNNCIYCWSRSIGNVPVGCCEAVPVPEGVVVDDVDEGDCVEFGAQGFGRGSVFSLPCCPLSVPKPKL